METQRPQDVEKPGLLSRLRAKFDREVFVIVAGLGAAVGAVFVARNYSLWILVPIPSAIAVVYHLLNLSSRYDSRKKIVETYQDFTRAFDATWTGRERPVASVSEDLTDDPNRHRPTLASVLWGAALLTAIFAIPAIISDGGAKIGRTTDPELANVTAAVQQAKAIASSAAPSAEALKKALAAVDTSLASAKKGLEEWQRALVFAGFGVWVLIVMRTIGRINAGGLNARFLINASLRAGAAMMLGFFAGVAGLFGGNIPLTDVPTVPTAYFLIGIFYPLFFELLRDWAYKLMKSEKSITKELPTSWIDGVDDDTQDILREVNVLSVQHLATADPGVLTVRSLFPFNRVLDLIDQAILVTYFRDKVVTLRKYGIRGVIDFVSLVQPILRNEPSLARQRNQAALAKMAAELEIPAESLIATGESVYDDYRVNLLMRLWQHTLQTDGYAVQRESAVVANTSPMMPIRGAVGQQDFSAFALPAQMRTAIDVNLREEATHRAIRFREENPDLEKPAEDWLTSSFAEAYTIAQQRATAGLSPKPGSKAKEVYEKAFLSALVSV